MEVRGHEWGGWGGNEAERGRRRAKRVWWMADGRGFPAMYLSQVRDSWLSGLDRERQKVRGHPPPVLTYHLLLDWTSTRERQRSFTHYHTSNPGGQNQTQQTLTRDQLQLRSLQKIFQQQMPWNHALNLHIIAIFQSFINGHHSKYTVWL